MAKRKNFLSLFSDGEQIGIGKKGEELAVERKNQTSSVDLIIGIKTSMYR